MADEQKPDDPLKDQLKTVRLDTAQIQKMAAQEQEKAAQEAEVGAVTQTIDTDTIAAAKAEATGEVNAGGVHDGRFGEKFDDELDVTSVVWVTVGVAVVTLVFFVGSWWLYQWLIRAEKTGATPPLPVVAAQEETRRLPMGPRLQSSPEAELEAMRHELGERLNGYGWVDEGAGVVHIPVDRAMDLVLAEGLPAAGGEGGAP